MADHLPGRGGPSPATASRTPDDLRRELRANGTVMLEPKRFELRSIAAGIAGVALLISLAGVILVLAGAAEVGLAAFGVTGFGLLIAGTLARISLFSRESQWVVDRRGLTIGGVGPIPWTDVAPTTSRMEQSLYDEGRSLTLVLPLTGHGSRRAALLPPHAQKVLDPGRSRALLGGERPMSAIRIPNMKGTPREDVARFLDGAMDLARRGLL